MYKKISTENEIKFLEWKISLAREINREQFVVKTRFKMSKRNSPIICETTLGWIMEKYLLPLKEEFCCRNENSSNRKIILLK